MGSRSKAPDLMRRMLRGVTNGTRIDPDTPARAARALAEQTAGYADATARHARTFKSNFGGIAAVRKFGYSSLCEHHVLPFWGEGWVAYLPDGRILGLSKFSRILNALSRRLCTQENLTEAFARVLIQRLKPRGLYIVLRGFHTCSAVRGIRDQGMDMVTSYAHGVFREDAAARAEAIAMLTEF